MTTHHLHVTRSIQESLKSCWKEGVANHVTLGMLEYYITPYALFLGASVMEIGILVSLPHLLGSWSQLLATYVVKWTKSRRLLLVRAATLQTCILVPLILLFLWPYPRSTVTVLIFLVCIIRILMSLLGSVWGSLVSEYLPAQKRGLYFGWRAQIVGLSGLAGVLCGGLILHAFDVTHTIMGFVIVFSIAALCRGVSIHYLKQFHDVPYTHLPEHQFTFFDFIKRFRESNFVKFVLYVSTLTFSTYLAAPFFSVFMLQDLKFNYASYMGVHVAGIVGGLIAFPIWGRHADVVGNAKMLKLSSLLIPAIPFLWILSQDVYYLIAVEFVSGIIWGGFNLCATNFIFEVVSPPKRVRCISYFNLINGSNVFLGSILGSWLATHLPPLRGFSLLSLFGLSAFLRFLCHFFLSKQFKEVRESAQPVSGWRLFFSVVRIRPLLGVPRGWNAIPLLEEILTEPPSDTSKKSA